MKIVFSSLMSLAFIISTSTEAQDHPYFPEERSYTYQIFETQKECDLFQQRHRFFNCHRMVWFKPDGRATLVVTDIANPMTYKISGETVFLREAGAGDAGKSLKLRLSKNRRHLIEEDGRSVWDLETK